jgi:hypothetical protein
VIYTSNQHPGLRATTRDFVFWILDLLHSAQVVSDVELGISLLLDLVNSDAGRQLGQRQLALGAVDLEDAEVSDDGADTACAGEGQSAVLHDLAHAVLVDVVGGNDNLGLVGVGDEVHGAAHALEDLRSLLVIILS